MIYSPFIRSQWGDGHGSISLLQARFFSLIPEQNLSNILVLTSFGRRYLSFLLNPKRKTRRVNDLDKNSKWSAMCSKDRQRRIFLYKNAEIFVGLDFTKCGRLASKMVWFRTLRLSMESFLKVLSHNFMVIKIASTSRQHQVQSTRNPFQKQEFLGVFHA